MCRTWCIVYDPYCADLPGRHPGTYQRMQGIVEKDNRKEGGVQGMRKFYKGSLITAACLIGTGLILTAAGGAAGIHEGY